MLVIITPENFLKNEVQFLNEFSKFSDVIFHIRKPNASKAELINFLEKLDASVLRNGMLHSHHKLTNQFNLRGKHFTEKERLNTTIFDSDKIISSSFHSIADLKKDTNDFDYHFLSPVFDSISKKNYQGKVFDVTDIKKKTIALGGVNKENIAKTKILGFAGVAILGVIWESSSPLKAFKEIKKSYEQSFT